MLRYRKACLEESQKLHAYSWGSGKCELFTPISLLFLSSSLKRSIISVYVVFTVQPNLMVRRLLSSSCVPKFSFVLLPSPTLRRKS